MLGGRVLCHSVVRLFDNGHSAGKIREGFGEKLSLKGRRASRAELLIEPRR